ncbi:MAG: hypothetical protein AAB834_02460, partial [Patescibacteria group bacterium]
RREAINTEIERLQATGNGDIELPVVNGAEMEKRKVTCTNGVCNDPVTGGTTRIEDLLNKYFGPEEYAKIIDTVSNRPFEGEQGRANKVFLNFQQSSIPTNSEFPNGGTFFIANNERALQLLDTVIVGLVRHTAPDKNIIGLREDSGVGYHAAAGSRGVFARASKPALGDIVRITDKREYGNRDGGRLYTDGTNSYLVYFDKQSTPGKITNLDGSDIGGIVSFDSLFKPAAELIYSQVEGGDGVRTHLRVSEDTILLQGLLNADNYLQYGIQRLDAEATTYFYDPVGTKLNNLKLTADAFEKYQATRRDQTQRNVVADIPADELEQLRRDAVAGRTLGNKALLAVV